MTIQENFDTVSTIIQNSNLIELWGDWCVNKTDKEVPYGIKPLSVNSSKETNVYSINDNVMSSGYSYIRSITDYRDIKGVFVVEMAINIFVNPKKIGRLNATYEIPMKLIGLLKRQYKDVRIQQNTSERFSFQEMATIIVPFKAYASCENIDLLEPVC
jgi:hypothetical protein